MSPFTNLLLLFVVTSSFYAVTSSASSQKLFLILLDGFRWDYVDKLNLPNFKRFYTDGARASYTVVDFPTLSYPNYYSLMTGLYSEDHGMTGNYMYEQSRDEKFLLGLNPEQYNSHWWDGGEPLWVTATKQNKRSYFYYWPGCEVTILGVDSTYCKTYVTVPFLSDFQDALGESLNLLANGTADLVGVYQEEPDWSGHGYGPDSAQLASALRDIDVEIGKVLDRLELINKGAAKESDKVNLMIFSDHGMTEISESRVINTTEVLRSDMYRVILDYVAHLGVYTTSQQQTDQVFRVLGNFHPRLTCYRKAEIPERYKYKNGKNIADVTCVPDLGWVILQPERPEYPKKNGIPMRGYHGYDNQFVDMRGIFYAYGPYFEAGTKVRSIESVDLYNYMCAILDITPNANSGYKNALDSLLAEDDDTGSDAASSTTISHILLLFPVALFVLMNSAIFQI